MNIYVVKSVYLISSNLDGSKVYKIGFTSRQIEKRLNELKTGNSNNLEVEMIFESKWANKIESILHKHYRNHRINGEWFSLKNEQVEDFLNLCQQSHNNIEILNKYNTWVQDKGGLDKIN